MRRLVHELSYCDASAEHAVHPNPAPGRCVMRGDYRRDDGTCTKYHAMLIIGVRGEGVARRFLVRNWWRRHQFVEVSLPRVAAAHPPRPQRLRRLHTAARGPGGLRPGRSAVRGGGANRRQAAERVLGLRRVE